MCDASGKIKKNRVSRTEAYNNSVAPKSTRESRRARLSAALLPTFVTLDDVAQANGAVAAAEASSTAAAAAGSGDASGTTPSAGAAASGESSASGASSASSAAAASGAAAPVASTRAKPFTLLESSQLPGASHRSKSIYLVIYGGSVTTKFLSGEIAPHIGLLIANGFADFEMCSNTAQKLDVVDGLYPTYGQAKYYRLPLVVNHVPWTEIRTLSKAFLKYNQANSGTHSQWPYHCRSYVSAVLFHILKIRPDRLSHDLPGLGLECQRPASMDILSGHMQVVLANLAGAGGPKPVSE